jgi:hypothetical protein
MPRLLRPPLRRDRQVAPRPSASDNAAAYMTNSLFCNNPNKAWWQTAAISSGRHNVFVFSFS